MCQTTSAHNTTGLHMHRHSPTHTSFYWGLESQIPLPGWPGSSRGMYALALFFVFSLGVIVECLSYRSMVKPEANKVAARLILYDGDTYDSFGAELLAVMSFNDDVFLVTVFGHAVGFLVFGSKAFWKARTDLSPRK
ncbi:copper transporter 4 [Hibiscus trionum]|uniref:Copper transporter 4 n=1 Tax=Hibiscus trionum TaxID=183268 RepID=A0A9W7H5G1_HIBTR|nr:copper transporter 4 [Hibiscus trionum]